MVLVCTFQSIPLEAFSHRRNQIPPLLPSSNSNQNHTILPSQNTPPQPTNNEHGLHRLYNTVQHPDLSTRILRFSIKFLTILLMQPPSTPYEYSHKLHQTISLWHTKIRDNTYPIVRALFSNLESISTLRSIL